jgi:hypothetical protein
MIDRVKSWLRENHTLVYFLIAQGLALGATVLSLLVFLVRLETRVSSLETRGSPHLEKIESQVKVLESQSQNNKERIDRLVDAMTK